MSVFRRFDLKIINLAFNGHWWSNRVILSRVLYINVLYLYQIHDDILSSIHSDLSN